MAKNKSLEEAASFVSLNVPSMGGLGESNGEEDWQEDEEIDD